MSTHQLEDESNRVIGKMQVRLGSPTRQRDRLNNLADFKMGIETAEIAEGRESPVDRVINGDSGDEGVIEELLQPGFFELP